MNMYGLLGEKLSHSYSPMIHKIFGDYEYELIELDNQELEVFLTQKNFSAVNVTIPYKKTVLPFLDKISDKALKIGSVNTIVNKDGTLYGYNTDYDGFLYMSNSVGIDFKDKNVVILGTGGTALTANAVAKDYGAKQIHMISKNINEKFNYSNIYELYDTEIIIQSTPVGMYPKNGECLVELSRFKNLCGVIDVIYNPLYTEFLFQAKELGIAHIGGLPMLAAQAKYASELFFDKKLSDTLIKKAVHTIQKLTENIVLIGMPGSGKSTIGKLLAEKMSREFVDTDNIIEEVENRSIPEIFEKDGEEYFRKVESEITAKVGKEKGLVIATGGGVVLSEKNRRALKQNSTVFFIKRPLELLARQGRPLSADIKSLEKMYEKRLPLYKNTSHVSIDNDNADETATKIAEQFYKIDISI